MAKNESKPAGFTRREKKLMSLRVADKNSAKSDLVMIGFRTTPENRKLLRQIALAQNCNVSDLLNDAIAVVLRKNRKILMNQVQEFHDQLNDEDDE